MASFSGFSSVLHRMILNPCSYAVSSTARLIEVKNGLRISETIKPRVLDCWERKLRATRFGRYPNRSTAAITRARTSGRTCRPLESTRDTVAVDTPAASATSLMLTIRTYHPLEEQTVSKTYDK